VIRHVVFVKFRPGASAPQIDEFMREVNRLTRINPEVRNWASGRSVEPRFHSGDFDWGLSVDLADWDAMDRYMFNPGHLRTGPFAAAVVDSMMSFDFEVECEVPVGSDAELTPASDTGGRDRVPQLRGRSLEAARRIAAEHGLRVEEPVARQRGSVWAPDRVVAQTPEAGAPVASGDTLRLTVSAGWSRVQQGD
jgi:hypothetical protein